MKSVISFFEKHAIGILSLTVILIAGYTTVGLQASDALRKANANEECIKEQGEKLNRIASTAERDIAVIQVDLQYVKKTVDEVRKDQKAIVQKIDKLIIGLSKIENEP